MKRVIWKNPNVTGESLPFRILSNKTIVLSSLFRIFYPKKSLNDLEIIAAKSNIEPFQINNDKDVENAIERALNFIESPVRRVFLSKRNKLNDCIVLNPNSKVDISNKVEKVCRDKDRKTEQSPLITATEDKQYIDVNEAAFYIGGKGCLRALQHLNKNKDDVVLTSSLTIKCKDVKSLVSHQGNSGGGMRDSACISIDNLKGLRQWCSYIAGEPEGDIELKKDTFCGYIEGYDTVENLNLGSDKAIFKLRTSSSRISTLDLADAIRTLSVNKLILTRHSNTSFDNPSAATKARNIIALDGDNVKSFVTKFKNKDLSSISIIGFRQRRTVEIDENNELVILLKNALDLDKNEIEKDKVKVEDNNIIELPPIVIAKKEVKNTNEEIVLDGTFELCGCRIRYCTKGERWSALIDIIIASGHCKMNNVNREIDRIFSDPQIEDRSKAKYKDKRNVSHELDVIPFNQITTFVIKYLKGKNSDALRTQMATLHSKWQAGDDSVIETTLINREISSNAPPDSFAHVNYITNNENQTSIEDSPINPIQTAIASGVPENTLPLLQRTPPSERICFTVRGKMDLNEFNNLHNNDMIPGFYVITFKPKYPEPPLKLQNPNGCMTLISSQKEAPLGGAKIGIFHDNGLDRIQQVCDSYFHQSLFDIHIKTAFNHIAASTLEKNVKRYLNRLGFLPQDPKTRSNFVLNEHGDLSKLSECMLFTPNFGESELMNVIRHTKDDIDYRINRFIVVVYKNRIEV